MRVTVRAANIDATPVIMTVESTIGEIKGLLREDDPQVPWPLKEAIRKAIFQVTSEFEEEVKLGS